MIETLNEENRVTADAEKIGKKLDEVIDVINNLSKRIDNLSKRIDVIERGLWKIDAHWDEPSV